MNGQPCAARTYPDSCVSTSWARVHRRTVLVTMNALAATVALLLVVAPAGAHAASPTPTTDLPASAMTAVLGLDVVTAGQAAAARTSLPGNADHVLKVAAERLMTSTATSPEAQAVVLTKVASDTAQEAIQVTTQTSAQPGATPSTAAADALARYAQAEQLLQRVDAILKSTPADASASATSARLDAARKQDQARLAQLQRKLETDAKPALDHARAEAQQHAQRDGVAGPATATATVTATPVGDGAEQAHATATPESGGEGTRASEGDHGGARPSGVGGAEATPGATAEAGSHERAKPEGGHGEARSTPEGTGTSEARSTPEATGTPAATGSPEATGTPGPERGGNSHDGHQNHGEASRSGDASAAHEGAPIFPSGTPTAGGDD